MKPTWILKIIDPNSYRTKHLTYKSEKTARENCQKLLSQGYEVSLFMQVPIEFKQESLDLDYLPF